MTNPSTGLVLTGGSLKGICAQTGLLMALDEVGYKVDAIIGTSAGSLVGAMYAAGMSGQEIHDTIASMKKRDYWDPDWWRLVLAPFSLFKGWHGLLKGKKLLNFLKRTMPVQNLEDCKIPMAICVTNVSRESPQVKTEGSIADWVRCSTSIPLTFRMHLVDGEYYVDGGAVNNNPLDELIDLAPDLDRYIVGTSLNVVKPEKDVNNKFRKRTFTAVRLIDRIIGAIGSEMRQENMEHGEKDVRIMKTRPGSIGLDEVHKAPEAIMKAYNDAKRQIAEGMLD